MKASELEPRLLEFKSSPSNQYSITFTSDNSLLSKEHFLMAVEKYKKIGHTKIQNIRLL